MNMTLNGDGHSNLNGWRTQPMYTFSEAAQLARVSTSTVRNWLRGYGGPEKEIHPIFTTHDRNIAMVSFLNLIEIVIAGQFRKALHVKYQTVISAYANSKEIVDSQYPFAHARLEPLGDRIVYFIKNQPWDLSRQAIDRTEQWSLPLELPPLPNEVLQIIDQIEYLQELAAKWFPVGRDVPIVIDPQVSTGIPTVEGTGVTIGAIHERFKAGHKIEFLARDYELEPGIVQTVIQYAMQHSELVAA